MRFAVIPERSKNIHRGNYNSSSRLEFVKITGSQIQTIAFDAAGNLIAAATDGSNAGYYL